MLGAGETRISRPCFDRQSSFDLNQANSDIWSFYRMEGRFPRAGLWVKTAGASPQGGVQISEAEKATLAEVSNALGIDWASEPETV